MKIQTIADGAGNRYHIPPRKNVKHAVNLAMRFVIPGIIPSKKNSQIALINSKRIDDMLRYTMKKKLKVDEDLIERIHNVKPHIVNANRYVKWEKAVIEDLILQKNTWLQSYQHKGIQFPIRKATISVYHYWKDNIRRDNSNKAEGIHDALVKAGILLDDDYKCLYKTISEADMYSGEILDHLTIFTITAHEW